jgi:hypothetical protein
LTPNTAVEDDDDDDEENEERSPTAIARTATE